MINLENNEKVTLYNSLSDEYLTNDFYFYINDEYCKWSMEYGFTKTN